MSIVLVGSTSGSITLQEPAIAGSTVLDLPATSGTILTTGSSGQSIPSAALPAGSVLQVVTGTLSGAVSTSSTSFVTTGLSASITPKFSTSKILIICTLANSYNGNAGVAVFETVYRNSTNIAPSGSGTSKCFATIYSIDTGTISNQTFSYLDSPSTTSSTSYTAYFAVNAGTGHINQNGVTSSIQLLEIAA